MPFKNFSKPEEAIEKLVSDAKRYGVDFSAPNKWNFFDLNKQLVQGHGESVVYLVDELLNRELFRRDFKFGTPVFPADSDSDSGEEEEKEDES